MPGKCRFQDIWLEEEKWRLWLRKGNGSYSGFCTLCKKYIDVSHSGLGAIKSHEKGKKHSEFENNNKSGKQLTLHCFKAIESSSTGTTDSMPSTSASHQNTLGETSTFSIPSCSNTVGLITDEPTSSSKLSSFLVKDCVTKAEILWATYCVVTHTSNRSGGAATDLFPLMFPDSSIASKIQLHKDKIAYSVTYGLGPYFSKMVASSAIKSPFFSLSVDESLNDICQKQQMDVMINFWDCENNCVSTRYLTSSFLERSRAVDLLEKIINCISESNLSLQNLVQLSTDGPNVNLKVIADLNSHLKNTFNTDREILDIGTCSLHIVNGAYKTAHAKVDWKLNQFMRALYRLFKNYPSRRAVYRQITNSSVFPQKFCAVRWTENSGVLRRCLEMLPHLKTYVKGVQEPPETENFFTVKTFLLQDRTLEAKLHFSAMIADELEDFLTCFQRNCPLLPFLHQELFNIMKSLGSRFIKKKNYGRCDNLCQITYN